MRKSEILRGHGAFRAVTTSGRRIDGTSLRSYSLATPSERPAIAIGVTVYDRTLNAVARNRIKRRLREAVTRERTRLFDAAAGAGVRLEVVLGYRPRGTPGPGNRPPAGLSADVARVIDGIISRIRQQWPQQ